MSKSNKVREFAITIVSGLVAAFNGLAGRFHVEPLSGTETAGLTLGVGVLALVAWSIAARRLPD